MLSVFVYHFLSYLIFRAPLFQNKDKINEKGKLIFIVLQGKKG